MPNYHATTIGRGVGITTPNSLGSSGQPLISDGAGGSSFAFMNSSGFADYSITNIKLEASSIDNSVQDFRITLETGVSASTSDQSNKTNVFLTPHCGNRIALYDGTRWVLRLATEKTLAVGTKTSGKNYDVFAAYFNDDLQVEFSAAWTSDTVRNDALALRDGVLVKSSDNTRRYVGTIRTVSTTEVNDSSVQRFCWNLDNKVLRYLSREDTSAHTYGTTTLRRFNDGDATRVEWIVGQAQEAVNLRAIIGRATGASFRTAVGYDSTSSASSTNAFAENTSNTDRIQIDDYVMSSLGYHFAHVLEYASVSGSFNFGRCQVSMRM